MYEMCICLCVHTHSVRSPYWSSLISCASRITKRHRPPRSTSSSGTLPFCQQLLFVSAVGFIHIHTSLYVMHVYGCHICTFPLRLIWICKQHFRLLWHAAHAARFLSNLLTQINGIKAHISNANIDICLRINHIIFRSSICVCVVAVSVSG